MSAAVAPKSHAELGASVASRWMACPGSVQLSRTVPAPPDTFYAKEGSAAHALAELSLRRGVDPDTFLGTTLEDVEVTEDMIEHVRLFIEHCRAKMKTATKHWIEYQFSLADLNPPVPMFGTADFVAYYEKERLLDVDDLKYGQGVLVEARGNKQLRYYALGAALELGKHFPIDKVRITIVQPRALHPNGPIRTEEISINELIDFAGELLEAARRTQEPGAPLKAGPHCRFCPAAGICPEQLRHAQEIAQVEFEAMPLDIPPDPKTLPVDMLAEMLPKLAILDDWIRAMRTQAQSLLEQGVPVPGYKLVRGRANRVWVDEKQTEQYLRAQGYNDEEIFVQKLKSPAQVEKLVGKKNLPEDLWQKGEGKLTLAPDTDTRPAVAVTPGDDFAALPAATS